MGFLDKILSREKEKEKFLPVAEKELGVCIPEARRQIMEKEAVEQKKKAERTASEQEQAKAIALPEFFDEKPRMSVEGIFAVIDTLMVKGIVASGKIQKGLTITIGKKKFRVKDLQFEGRSAPHLLRGQTGAVFFDKAKGLTLKAGTILEFKQK